MKLAPASLALFVLGACGSGGSSAPAIEVTVQSRTESSLTLMLKSDVKLFNIWAPACRYGKPPRLQRLDGGVWSPLRDDRPIGTWRPAHYLDGVLETDCSLGCDGGDICSEAAAQLIVDTREYVQVGTRQPTEAICGSAITSVPDIVSRPTQGPYRFEFAYLTNGCAGVDHQETTVILPVPDAP